MRETAADQVDKKVISPGSNGYNLVRLQEQFSLSAGWVLVKHLIHDEEQLFDPLVLAQVLPALHQEIVVLLIITPDCDTLGFPQR